MDRIEKKVLQYLKKLSNPGYVVREDIAHGVDLSNKKDVVRKVINNLEENGYVCKNGPGLVRITAKGEEALNCWQSFLKLATPIAAFIGAAWAIVDIILRIKSLASPIRMP